MERIGEELRVRERGAAETRDHDARLVFRLLIMELEETEIAAVEPLQPAGSTPARLYFDGGSRGNPGTAGSGAVLLVRDDDTWNIAWYGAKYLGASASNNVAEYEALLLGLHAAQDLQLENIAVYGDSQLISDQLQGRATVKNATLATAFQTARDLLENTRRFTITYTNTMADYLANKAMDAKQSCSKRVGSSGSGDQWLLRQIEKRKGQDLLFKPHAGAKSREEARAAVGRLSG
ncbi:hypothetical protein PybrP1_004852 [[Pythium] brassicae (nom. inval.)]|nr:hypothetical protein PybrP1_004852 [[Pythium] brassicae (nom. inval.)]